MPQSNHPRSDRELEERARRFREELGREMTPQERRFLDYAEQALEKEEAAEEAEDGGRASA